MLKTTSKEAPIPNDTVERFGRRHEANGIPATTGSRTVSVLGGGMTVNGDVTGDGELRIEGHVQGSVTTTGRVIVEASGEVEGGIEAGEVVASGKVSGKITAKGAVRLKSGCRVEANVHAPTIELEEGGFVNGRLEMKKSS